MIEIETRLVYEKQFKNLQLQEARLNRRLEKDMAQLRGLQEARKAREAEELAQAAAACLLAQHRNEPFDFAALGFEFSKERFESHLAKLTQAVKQQLLQKALADTAESMKAPEPSRDCEGAARCAPRALPLLLRPNFIPSPLKIKGCQLK